MTTITRTFETVIDRIIAEEVLVNASCMVTELAQDGEGRYIDDLAPCLDSPNYSEAPDGYKVQKGCNDESWYWYNTEEEYDEDEDFEPFSTERDAILAAWDDAGDEPEDRIEALQHWVVSDWLADKLEEVGALVARDVLGFDIWGRTECGQGLDQDSDLNKVVALIEASHADL